MSIKTYKTIDSSRTKVFFEMNEENDNLTVHVGNSVVVKGTGFQFYVDDYVADQIDKCELFLDGLTPKLRLKEGETLEVPEKSEKEKEIERLEYELEQAKNAE